MKDLSQRLEKKENECSYHMDHTFGPEFIGSYGPRRAVRSDCFYIFR